MTAADYDKENIFAKIIDGKEECTKVFENRHVIAILDAFPVTKGHVVVIPKVKGYSSLIDMPPRTVCDITSALPIIGKAVRDAMGADGVNIIQNNGAASGQTVMHPHFHIIPRKEGDKLFSLPSSGGKIEADEAKEVGEQLTKVLDASKPATREKTAPLKKAKYTKIGDCSPTMSGLNARIKIMTAPKEVESRKDLYECKVGDATGVMTLNLKKAQLADIKEGETMELRNFFIQMVKGHIRAAIDKWGKLTVTEEKIETVKEENDVSLIEYELVE